MHHYPTSGLYTDLYQLAMSQAYFLAGRADESASFDYFFRKMPFGSGYVIFAGLQDLLNVLEQWHFSEADLEFLQEKGFKREFLQYLKSFRFEGSVFTCREGEVVFANEPVMRIDGNIIECQLIESVLLNIINFQSLIATKAARITMAAAGREVSEFGLRRAQGTAAMAAARAATIGGVSSTSNVLAAKNNLLEPAGTMAHSFIQSFDSELEAFRSFAAADPERCIFLVDTYNTLKSGLPNAIKVAKEMEARGERAIGIRLDSGDLAFLANEARKQMDAEGLNYMKIVASNQLDEYLVKSLVDQKAPIDVFGVGTSLTTGHPDGALDGVYKLCEANGQPRMKISENQQKMTLPGRKQVIRTFDANGQFYGADAVVLYGEDGCAKMFHPVMSENNLELTRFDQQPLLFPVWKNRRYTNPAPDLQQIAAYAKNRLSLLPEAYKRFYYPHQYKVGLSENLLLLREKLRKQNLDRLR